MTILNISLETTRHFVNKYYCLLGLKEHSFLNGTDHMTKKADMPVDSKNL